VSYGNNSGGSSSAMAASYAAAHQGGRTGSAPLLIGAGRGTGDALPPAPVLFVCLPAGRMASLPALPPPFAVTPKITQNTSLHQRSATAVSRSGGVHWSSAPGHGVGLSLQAAPSAKPRWQMGPPAGYALPVCCALLAAQSGACAAMVNQLGRLDVTKTVLRPGIETHPVLDVCPCRDCGVRLLGRPSRYKHSHMLGLEGGVHTDPPPLPSCTTVGGCVGEEGGGEGNGAGQDDPHLDRIS
jgi:hypothetical protein